MQKILPKRQAGGRLAPEKAGRCSPPSVIRETHMETRRHLYTPAGMVTFLKRNSTNCGRRGGGTGTPLPAARTNGHNHWGSESGRAPKR